MLIIYHNKHVFLSKLYLNRRLGLFVSPRAAIVIVVTAIRDPRVFFPKIQKILTIQFECLGTLSNQFLTTIFLTVSQQKKCKIKKMKNDEIWVWDHSYICVGYKNSFVITRTCANRLNALKVQNLIFPYFCFPKSVKNRFWPLPQVAPHLPNSNTNTTNCWK